jgi:hypothetical protein
LCAEYRELFLRLAEALCLTPDPLPRCEGCGQKATAILDGHALCDECETCVSAQVCKEVLALRLAPTVIEIRQLPEAEDPNGG